MTTSSIPQIAAQTSGAAAPMKLALLSPTDVNAQADAARFGQALASAPPLPEHQLLSAAGKLAGRTEHLEQRVPLHGRALDDPTHLLVAQREITERVVALEFVAKVAGATTQAVNKLVHMQ